MKQHSDHAKIQVPIKASIKKKAEEVAENYGYSSIQEVIRIFLTHFSKGEVEVILSSPHVDEYISPEFEEFLDKKRAEIEREIKKGKSYTAESAQDIIDAARIFKDEED